MSKGRPRKGRYFLRHLHSLLTPSKNTAFGERMGQRLRTLAAFMDDSFNSKHPLGDSQPSCNSSTRAIARSITLLWPPQARFRYSILTYIQTKHSHTLGFALDLAVLWGMTGRTLANDLLGLNHQGVRLERAGNIFSISS